MSIDVDFRDLEEKTPLHRAIENGCKLEEIQTLLSLGADPNATDMSKKTPMHIAVEKKARLEIFDALLQSGGNVNAKNADDETVLYSAVKMGSKLEVIKVLLSAGGDINHRVNQTTLLHLVRRADVTRELLSHGLNVNATNHIGQTPLHYVLSRPIKSHCLEVVRELLNQKADPNAEDCSRSTPLHVTTLMPQRTENVEIVKELIKHGGNLHAIDLSGRIPLYNVMEYIDDMDSTDPDNVELLWNIVCCGCDVNIRCGYRTPLDVAISKGNMFWIKLVIKVALLKSFDDDKKRFMKYQANLTASQCNDLCNFLNGCVAEIHHMKIYYLNAHLSLYDFVFKFKGYDSKLILFINPESIVEGIDMNYPIYSNILLPRIKLCLQRVDAIDKLKELHISAICEGKEVILIYDCLRKVSEYLLNSDLENLITASHSGTVK